MRQNTPFQSIIFHFQEKQDEKLKIQAEPPILNNIDFQTKRLQSMDAEIL